MNKTSVENQHCESALEERRTHHRHPANLTVQVYWRGAAGELESAAGVIRNISGGGFGLELERPLEDGQLLSVQTKEGALQCVVRHVRTDNAKYFVGMEVISASDGSNHERSLKELALVLARSNRNR